MASIRNSISLTDRMTPTFRSILKAMDSTLRVMKNLDKQSNNGVQSKAYKRAEKDIQRASNALIKMDNHTKMAASSALAGEKAYSRMGTAVGVAGAGMDKLNDSASGFLQSLASGVYLAQKLADKVEAVMTKSDTSRSQVARLGLYNTSSYSNEELYGQVFSTAMNTRSDLTDTMDLVNKLLISDVYTGSSAVQAAIGTAGIINKALIAGGGTSEENQRALRQLTQGLASGVLQGDELRSIREQTPYFAQVLAEGLSQIDERFEGIGIGDLKRLGAEGELTADRVVKAMWAMQDEIDEDFKKMPRTFGQAMTSLGNIWTYFLFLLSTADGPLGKLNDRLWQFVDYLQSPQGLELLETVAIGINAITTALSWVMQKVGDFVTYLQENAPVAQALFISLGVVAAAAGLKAAIAWISACWPILLVAAAVGLVAYAFLDAGYSAEEFIGGLIGGIGMVIAYIWNAIVWIGIAVLWLGMIIAIAALMIGAVIMTAIILIVWAVMWILAVILMVLVGAGTAILLTLQAVVQIVVWAVLAIVTVIWFILTVVKTVFLLIETVIRGVIVGIVGLFYGLAQTVLGIMNLIARSIDAVFGSDLAVTVSEWQGSLEGKFTSFVEEHGPQKSVEEIGDVWTDFGSGVADMFTSEELNLYDEMGNVFEGGTDLIGSIYDGALAGDQALYDGLTGTWDFALGTSGDMLMGGLGTTFSMMGSMADPDAQYNAGYNFGAGIVDEIGNISLGSGESLFNANEVEVSGGYLDGINSDVAISDEDLQLLRDMAARDYLLQLQSITPVAHVTFGDVRETADVGKIVEVIEQMVEEQMATALVS